MCTAARIAGLLGLFALSTCAPAPRLPEHLGRVEGSLALQGARYGDAWLFLFGSGEGPPTSQALPRYATAVPEVRLERGDGRFVFSGVEPGAYRLWGFLDADRSFRPDLDVLAQPGAGDRRIVPAELVVEEGGRATQDLTQGDGYRHHPPAFRVETALPVVELPDQPLGLYVITVVSDGLGVLEGPRFAVTLVDADGDGEPDDSNGDGVPELSPQLFLRFLPKPGQSVPTDGEGRRLEVIVPLLYNPAPFLAVLGGDLAREVVADQLQGVLVPQARSLTPRPNLPPLTAALPAIPVGDYELWAVSSTGQFWRVPNSLATQGAAAVGGPFASQATRFRFIHGTGLGGPPRPAP